MFFWNSLAFLMIQWMLKIWSLVPLPFLKPAWTSGSSRLLLKSGLENFEHYFTSMWDECNCEVVWAFFGIAWWHHQHCLVTKGRSESQKSGQHTLWSQATMQAALRSRQLCSEPCIKLVPMTGCDLGPLGCYPLGGHFLQRFPWSSFLHLSNDTI